jgi:FAD:protein FMN transferase
VVREASWRALGTGVQVLVLRGDVAAAASAVAALLERVDLTYSRFRPDSELARLNARAGETLTVSPLMARAVDVALRAARLTDGLVDPTLGRSLRSLGYDRDFSLLRRDADPTRPLVLRLIARSAWQDVRLNVDAGTLRVPAGIELDLGATGKALASDLAAAAALEASRASGVLVNLGGDLAMAGTAPAGGWRVLATDDSRTPPDTDGEVVSLRDGGVATSSTRVRQWTRGGVALHHLLDPRTGLPAQTPWRTVSVLAATCLDANTASTAAVIRGESAPEWLASLHLAARLVRHDGRVQRVAGWPQPLGAAA